MSSTHLIKPFYSILLLLICYCCEATLWGIAGIEYIDGNGALVTYDITNGKPTTQVKTDPSFLTNPNLACYDNIHNLYYNIYEIEAQSFMRLYGFDLTTPSNGAFVTILSQFDFIVNPIGSSNLCIADPNTGDLYIMGYSANITTTTLLYRATYSNKSLNMNLVNSYSNMNIYKYTQYSPYPRIYDSKRNMIWFTVLTSMNGRDNTYNYYYLNAKNGQIMNNISNDKLIWKTANYYSKLDEIIALNTNSTAKSMDIYLLNPIDLSIVNSFEINLINGYPICQIEMMSTLDEKNGIVWLMVYSLNNGWCGDGYLVGLYVNNGTLVNNNPHLVCTTGIDVLCPESFQWTQ